SSRRRHTRFSRDWSSDVCSSDLGGPGVVEGVEVAVPGAQPGAEVFGRHLAVALADVAAVLVADVPQGERRVRAVPLGEQGGEAEIGRASCREREEMAVQCEAWNE